MTELQKKQIAELRANGYGYIKIARELDLSENTIKSYCRRNNLNGKAKARTNDTDRCKYCGKNIIQTKGRKPRAFCSDECRILYWKENQNRINRKSAVASICPVCHNSFFDYAKNNRKYCCHQCYIAARYRGGAL